MSISVLVVDDSVVIRKLVTGLLDADPDLSVVGTAAHGRIALAKIEQLNPDLVVLDIEMPVMDGLETLRELRRTRPRLPVVMFSALTERAASATLEALSLGANDYVAKPSGADSAAAGLESVRSQLVPKIKGLCAALLPGRPAVTPRQAAFLAGPARQRVRPRTPSILAFGASTGGPEALTEVLRALPATLPVPVVVVQHMPAVFTAMFAQRLDAVCALRVKQAEDGDVLEPGLVLIAPGGFHLTVQRTGTTTVARLDTEPQENHCRPAVDPLFRSIATTYGGAALAVVLTGMGSDGLRGAEALSRVSAPVIVQDAASSVVWGMPGSIADAGLAHAVLPLSRIAGEVLAAVGAVPAARTAVVRP